MRQQPLSRPSSPHYRGFPIILTHTTLDRTLLDKWSARRRDLHLTTHNIHKTKTSIPPTGFEPVIPASERPQTHALNSVTTGVNGKICKVELYRTIIKIKLIETSESDKITWKLLSGEGYCRALCTVNRPSEDGCKKYLEYLNCVLYMCADKWNVL
jgi:hypothetical protein